MNFARYLFHTGEHIKILVLKKLFDIN